MRFTGVQQLSNSRIARYCVVGIINTAFSYGVFAILAAISDHYDLNLMVSTILGILFAFGNSRKYVFRSQRSGRFFHYLLGYGFAFLVNLLILNGLLATGFNALAAQAVSMPIVIVVSYFINATIVFSPELPPLRDKS